MTDGAIAPRAATSGFWDIRYVNPKRTLTLCAAGALIGLGIAGYGLFTATGTTTAIYPAEDAAIVNGVPILMVDLVGQVRALYDLPLNRATTAQKRKALDDMIREELYVQRGVELGMPSDDVDVRTALVGAAEAQTASEAMMTVPTVAQLREFYRTHRDKYASEGVMLLTDWLVPVRDLTAATAIAARLRNGGQPRAFDLMPSNLLDDQEQFYFAARIHLGPKLFAVAEAMPNATVSTPISDDKGRLHILVMTRNEPRVPAPYEAVQARVLIDFMDAVKKQALAENTKFLFGRARITVTPALR